MEAVGNSRSISQIAFFIAGHVWLVFDSRRCRARHLSLLCETNPALDPVVAVVVVFVVWFLVVVVGCGGCGGCGGGSGCLAVRCGLLFAAEAST